MDDTTTGRKVPQPEPIRFYGTTWTDRSGGYALRRAGLALGAFAAAAAYGFLLLLAYQGLRMSSVGTVLNALVVSAFAACTVIAFTKSWRGHVRRPAGPRDEGADRAMHTVRLIGLVGPLLAYGIRSLVEAPGEKLRRAEYEEAVEAYERRRAARTGNPAKRGRTKSRRGS